MQTDTDNIICAETKSTGIQFSKNMSEYPYKNLNDFSRLGYILNNYDDIELSFDKKGKPIKDKQYRNSDNTGALKVLVSKKINGTYYCVIVVPDSSSHTIVVKSVYIGNKNKSAQEFDAETPNLTPKNDLESDYDTNVP